MLEGLNEELIQEIRESLERTIPPEAVDALMTDAVREFEISERKRLVRASLSASGLSGGKGADSSASLWETVLERLTDEQLAELCQLEFADMPEVLAEINAGGSWPSIG